MSQEKIYKSIKYRIFPTNEQKQLMKILFGARRYAWNYFVNLIFNTDYLINSNEKFKTSKFTLSKHIRKCGPKWIAEGSEIINKTIIDNTALEFESSYKKYKNKHLKNDNRPLLKNKKNSYNNFAICRKSKFCFKIIDGQLNTTMTRKLGRQTFKSIKSINIDASLIKMIYFIERNGKYYMTLVYENQVKSKPYISNTKIGIDLGMKTSAVCYDGNSFKEYHLPNEVIKLRNKKDKINSRYGKAKNDSKNKIKLLKRLNKSYRRMVNFRNNWQDHIVKDISENYETIIIDKMPLQNTGFKNINRKLISLGTFRFIYRFLQRSLEYGNKIFTIKPGTPTTQTCSNCSNVKKDKDKLTLNDRTYICNNCGYEEDRDKNSALFIYKYGEKYSIQEKLK